MGNMEWSGLNWFYTLTTVYRLYWRFTKSSQNFFDQGASSTKSMAETDEDVSEIARPGKWGRCTNQQTNRQALDLQLEAACQLWPEYKGENNLAKHNASTRLVTRFHKLAQRVFDELLNWQKNTQIGISRPPTLRPALTGVLCSANWDLVKTSKCQNTHQILISR